MRQWCLLLFSVLLILPTQEVAGRGLDDRQGRNLPRVYLGCLPFPGLFTMHESADPQRLGVHHYETNLEAVFEHEKTRGILYTCRGGFLDLAHIRATADYTAYVAYRVDGALEERKEHLVVKTPESSRFHLHFTYPFWWDDLDERVRQRLVYERAVSIGQHVSFVMSIWHEMITWHGYNTFVFSEKRSAFSYEDMYSNLLGTQIAGVALWDTERDYNEALTLALDETLEYLGVVSLKEAKRAREQVKHRWWKPGAGETMRRYLDIGLEAPVLRPWLVAEDGGCAGSDAQKLPAAWPSVMDDVPANFFTLHIEPVTAAGKAIHAVLANRPERIQPEEHFAEIMEQIRTEMAERYGEQVDQPD